jgi:hypothetical protein
LTEVEGPFDEPGEKKSLAQASIQKKKPPFNQNTQQTNDEEF